MPDPTQRTQPGPGGAIPRPVGGTEKLGTFAGVFVPVTLNVLSILMFLRFGFLLGQAGLVGMMGKSSHHASNSATLTTMTAMLVAGYLINLLTTSSISAIATNGTVRGGGAYYLISVELLSCILYLDVLPAYIQFEQRIISHKARGV